MAPKQSLVVLLALSVLLQAACALPDSSTSASGNDCRRAHSLSYSYSVSAPKSVTEGETFTVGIDFKLTADSRVRSAARTVSADLAVTNAASSSASQTLSSNHAEWQVTATKAGTASFTISTKYEQSGAPAHGGYKAVYKDAIKFSITVNPKEPPAAVTPPTPPVVTPPQNATLPPAANTTPVQNTTPPANEPPVCEPLTGNGTQVITSSADNNTQVITQEFTAEFDPDPDPTSWYMTRALGLAAYALLFLSVLTAILKRTRYTPKLTLLFKYHHDISIFSLVFALFHGLSNLFDSYMWNLRVDQVFIPQFGSDTQTFIGIGVAAFYIMALVTLTSVAVYFMKRLGGKRWKYVHMTSYLAFFFVFAHSLLLGSDLKDGPMLYVFWASGFIMLAVSADALALRISRKNA